MQGWRVSMEDAHIAALNLDPTTNTSLFSVFDGHGGHAVAKYCSLHLGKEFMRSEAYARGDLAGAITHAYHRLDVLLDSEEGKAELKLICGKATKKEPSALFTEVEVQTGEVAAEAAPAAVPEGEGGQGQEREQRDGSGRGGERSEGRGGDQGGRSNRGPELPRKIDASKDFLASHLTRASVMTPIDAEKAEALGVTPNGVLTVSEANAAAAGAVTVAAATDLFAKEAAAKAAAAAAPGEPAAAAAAAAPQPAASSSSSGGGAAAAAAAAAAEEEGDGEREDHHAGGVGCTALSMVVVVANTGDSRCVLSRKGQAIALTLDHKPILFEEARRIIKARWVACGCACAGGFVRDNRINGALNVSRTIGDLDFKRNSDLGAGEQMVIATPDIEQLRLEEGDEFAILACDGIWDVLSNQEAVDFVRRRLRGDAPLQRICEELCDYCLAPDLKGLCRGADNMSVIVVLFRKTAHLSSLFSKLWHSIVGGGGSKSAHKTKHGGKAF
eukprot:scaffold25.g5128.t1